MVLPEPPLGLPNHQAPLRKRPEHGGETHSQGAEDHDGQHQSGPRETDGSCPGRLHPVLLHHHQARRDVNHAYPFYPNAASDITRRQ